MAHGDDSIEVERIGLGDSSQMVCGARYVFKCSGPASALISYPTVFDAPGCEAGIGQRRAKVADVRKAVLRHPTPAVNDNGDRVRPRAFGQAQLAELKFVRAVSDAMIGRRRGTSQNASGRLILSRADDGERCNCGQEEREDDK